jgi:hypothetical protein
MARYTTWTPEEDAILIATAGQGIETTNEGQVEAGFAERTKNQITGRRAYLKKTKKADTVAGLLERRDPALAYYLAARTAYEDVVRELDEKLAAAREVTQRELGGSSWPIGIVLKQTKPSGQSNPSSSLAA